MIVSRRKLGEKMLQFFQKIFNQDTIRKQLRTWVSFFAIMMGTFVLIPTIFIEYMESTNEVDDQLEIILHSKANYFDKWVKERSKDIHTIANLDIVRDYKLDEVEDYFLFFRDEKEYFADLVFINKEGYVIYDTVDRSLEGITIDVNDREYFKVAKETKEPYITDVMISLVTDKPIVIFASPILDDRNEFNGVIFGSVNLETIDDILSESISGFQGHSYVVLQDGTLISELKQHLGPANLNSDEHEKYAVGEEILSLLKNNENSEVRKYRGVQNDYVLGSSILVNNDSWYLVSEIKITDVYLPFLKKVSLLFVMIVVSMFVALRIMLYIAEKIEKPIQLLLKGVRNMESGNYDYRINESDFASSTKEFRELVAAFNQMSGRVSENVDTLEELSLTCQLTKLYNRRYLMEHAQSIFYQCVRTANHCSCIIVDIDYFKKVNDTYGHIVGDQVLIHLANILTSSVRSSDVVTRYGGEEFIIICPKSSIESSYKIAERIQRKIKENPYRDGDVVIEITVSIGIADYLYSDDIITFTELIDAADKALYEAKESGRNQIVVANNKKTS